MSELSDYERQRLRNISRNNKLMVELGIASSKPQLKEPPKKRAKTVKTPTPAPTRRSSRSLGMPAPNYKPNVLDIAESRMDRRSEPSDKKRKGVPSKPTQKFPSYSGPSKPLPKDHVKELKADMRKLELEQLGKKLEATGKAYVMDTSCAEAGTSPRFSKYSGITEWRNCIFLWVNIGGKDYSNQFMKEGQQMTWWAGSRHHEETPVVKRLLRLTQKASASATKKKKIGAGGGSGEEAGSWPDSVILFMRLPGEPYVCCGRCAYVSHNFEKHPLKFVWELVDHKQLEESGSFKELVSEGD
jgi:hypothetical protein